MSKLQLIEAIRQHNRSASDDFLTEFKEEELVSYLHHLRFISSPRGQQSTWIRPGDTHAVVTRIH